MKTAKTLRMQLVEARAGRPLKEVLEDLYDQHNSVQGVADALGITRQALWNWTRREGITTDDLKASSAKRKQRPQSPNQTSAIQN